MQQNTPAAALGCPTYDGNRALYRAWKDQMQAALDYEENVSDRKKITLILMSLTTQASEGISARLAELRRKEGVTDTSRPQDNMNSGPGLPDDHSAMTDKETIIQLLSKAECLELQLHNTRRPALPDVEKYDGKSAFQLKSLMAELKNKHAQDGEVLGGDKGFVHYAYSRLTGKARSRVSPYIENYLTMKDGKKC
ncbi:hypothetical protein CFO_g5608 [Ceratocystis platani]|uniref:Uncharacterized protein n=1 Tax=Ceratocystis fimbriata f. sp. platani TaxID=88771 RepID=A0A0F8AZ15_CERFI|nr:hypothetical protein CFO_g5608 [Ceratocystis platani]